MRHRCCVDGISRPVRRADVVEGTCRPPGKTTSSHTMRRILLKYLPSAALPLVESVVPLRRLPSEQQVLHP